MVKPRNNVSYYTLMWLKQRSKELKKEIAEKEKQKPAKALA